MSVQEYTVTAVSERTKDWQGQKGGPMRSYYLKLNDQPERVVEFAQKQDSPPPKQGDKITGTLESRDHNGTTYWKLRKHFAGGGGKGGNFKADPRKNAAIAMESAIKASLHYHELLLAAQQLPEGKVQLESVHQVAGSFYGQIVGAMDGAGA